MLIHNDIQLDFDDVLIAPQTTTINHRGEVDIEREFKYIGLKCIPIMSANMTQTGTIELAEKLIDYGMCATLHKFYTADDIIVFLNVQKQLHNDLPLPKYQNVFKRIFITVGKRNWKQELEKLDKVKKSCEVDFSILLDVPNAYIPEITDCVKQLRELYPNQIIAVGNVCSGDETQKLILAGATYVKCGIGPSKICDTRIKTGCGRPQLSAIIECANAAHQVGGHIIADGGFKMNGDFCKAFVAGADMCMTGSMFAGCEESSGFVIKKYYATGEYSYEEYYNSMDEKTEYAPFKPLGEMKFYKEYYGMSSFRAQKENYGKTTTTGTSEGVECKLIPYTGPIIDTLNDIAGSLRSCGSYIGAKNIKNFSRQGMFYKVNRIK